MFTFSIKQIEEISKEQVMDALKESQEFDQTLNQFNRGEISIQELERKRAELYKELQEWNLSLEDRAG
jgi:hypothetical protein